MGRISNRIFTLAAVPLAMAATPALANNDGGNQAMAPLPTAPSRHSAPIAAVPPVADPRALAALERSIVSAGIALPQGGLTEACAGFRSLLRCVGALHIAQNVRAPGGFAPVREMLLYDDQASLADAARSFAPELDPIAAERTAQGQARADFRKAGITT